MMAERMLLSDSTSTTRASVKAASSPRPAALPSSSSAAAATACFSCSAASSTRYPRSPLAALAIMLSSRSVTLTGELGCEPIAETTMSFFAPPACTRRHRVSMRRGALQSCLARACGELPWPAAHLAAVQPFAAPRAESGQAMYSWHPAVGYSSCTSCLGPWRCRTLATTEADSRILSAALTHVPPNLCTFHSSPRGKTVSPEPVAVSRLAGADAGAVARHRKMDGAISFKTQPPVSLWSGVRRAASVREGSAPCRHSRVLPRTTIWPKRARRPLKAHDTHFRQ
jgi:hypothetical protein